MLIRATDLDALTLQTVMQGLGAAMRKPDPSPELQRFLAEDARRFRPEGRRFGRWALGGVLAAGVLMASLLFGTSASFAYKASLVAMLASFGIGLGSMLLDQWRRAQVVHSDLLG